MTNSGTQGPDTGPSQENKSRPLSRESSPTMNATGETKEQDAEPSKKSSTPTSKKTKTNSLENEPVSGSETILPKKPKSQMPVPKLPPEKTRTEEALLRLKIKPETLAAAPQISPTIKSCVKGGFKTALEAMRFSQDDSEIAMFLRKYDSIPLGDRNHLPWEAIAVAARVNTKHLIGSILLAVSQHCATKSKFIVASNHPMITKNRVKFAQMVGGEKDRSALDIMAGAQQGSSGHTFIGKAWFGGAAASKPVKDDDDDTPSTPAIIQDDSYGDLFPSPNQTQDKLVPIRQRLLEP